MQKESHKIKKHPQEPVVIYMVSPKVIHVEASEFMGLVQRLTGPSSSPPVDGHPLGVDGSSTGNSKREKREFPVRVKARPFNRSGSVAQSSMSPTLFLHDLSPLPYHNKGTSVSPRSWFLHGDCMDEGSSLTSGNVPGSPNYLDIFGHEEQ